MTTAPIETLSSPAPVRQVVSPGGVEVWHVESPLVPLVALAFAFEGGAAQDPAQKPGVAQMLARLLDEGAGPYGSDAFQERLAARAIELTFHAGPDAVGGSLKTLVKHADEAFELLRLALAEPRFDPDAVERVRAQTIGPALPGERCQRGGLQALLRRGVPGSPVWAADRRHGGERGRDHARRSPAPASRGRRAGPRQGGGGGRDWSPPAV